MSFALNFQNSKLELFYFKIQNSQEHSHWPFTTQNTPQLVLTLNACETTIQA